MNAAERGRGESPALVIGLGNRYRSDDAAGLAVAERIREAGPPGLEVIELEAEPVSLVDVWAGYPVVYLVDAVSSGGEPGTVYRFDATSQPPPAQFRNRGTHAFSVADAVQLARALGRLPRQLITYGIEGAAFRAGRGLSPEAEKAVAAVAAQLLDELARNGGQC
jgi:hydrogenase maturation protease